MIGLNVALALVERGCRVVTIDDHSAPVFGSSGRGGSSLGIIDKQAGPMRELAVRSIARFHKQIEQLGGSWLHMVGGLVPIRIGEELAARRIANGDELVQWLEQDELALVTTLLDRRKVAGALYVDGEGRIDVGAFAHCALNWLRASGRWTYRTGRAVDVVDAGDFARISLDDVGSVVCDRVVIVPGYDIHGLARRLGVAYVQEPCRGLILAYGASWVTGRDPIMLGLPYVQARYDGHGAVGSATGVEVSFSLEAPPGVLRIGSSREYVGFTEVDSGATSARILAEAQSFMTVKGTPTIMTCWRPVTASGVPVAGRLPGCAAVFCALGFEGHGVCVSAAVGDDLAEYVAQGDCPVTLQDFDPASQHK